MRKPHKIALAAVLTLVGAYLVVASVSAEAFTTGGINAAPRNESRAFFQYIAGALCISAGVFELSRLVLLPAAAGSVVGALAGIAMHGAIGALALLAAVQLHSFGGSRLQWLMADVCLVLINARFAMSLFTTHRRQAVAVPSHG